MQENSIAIYPSHDASVCVCVKGVYRIYELERLTKNRYEYLSLGNRINPKYQAILKRVRELINLEFGVITFDKCYINNAKPEIKECIKSLWGINSFVEVSHHVAHAATSYYLSGYNRALIISYDGGGMDLDGVSHFNIFKAEGKEITRVCKLPYDLGTAYLELAKPIKELRKTGINLSLPGKLMGLYAYGSVIPKYVEVFKGFFKTMGQHEGMLQVMGDSLGLDLSLDGVEGNDSYNIAASAQATFEEVVVEAITPFIEEYKDLPICLAGGCALNVLMNEIIRSKFKVPVFVPPNPSDCGLSFGMIVSEEPPEKAPSIAYSGPKLFDIDFMPEYIHKYQAVNVGVKEIARLLADGAIIGVALGGSECGPRALGNRSIICDPGIEGMKDILNNKVKHREWFRPFAPFVRAEECKEYFEFNGDSPFMSFAAPVRKEWKVRLSSITHVDGTARIQTVRKEDHDFFYEVLGEFKKIKGYGVLLNTSFNIKGRPILNTIEDALSVLEETDMDYVLIDNNLFKKL
jgi:carbamoyltransferase